MLFHKRNIFLITSALMIVLVTVLILFLNNKQPQNESVTTETTKKENYSTTTTSTTEHVMTIEEQLNVLISQMTLDEKVGQLFLARVPESNQIEDIKNYHLSGYLLFGRDIIGEDKLSLKKKIADFKNSSEIPLLIASDEEGGTVTRISQNNLVVSEKFRSPQEIYLAEGMAGVLADVRRKSEIFRELGIHSGLYPVADISVDPESFIYDRTIGLDVEGTSDYIAQVVSELNKEGIGSTLKHFPGYGDNFDSHVDVVRDTRSLEEINQESLPPFEAGIAAGADSILISHNIIEGIDSSVPASLSPKVVDVLRTELGFQGVIMTDDMDMSGLAEFISQEAAALAALKSGVDLILSSTYQQQIPIVISAVLNGEYTEQALEASVLRILNWKYKLGIIKLEDE